MRELALAQLEMLNIAFSETVTHRTSSSGDCCATCLRDIWGPIRGILNRNVSFARAASRLVLHLTSLMPHEFGGREKGHMSQNLP